jgi:hypothetical protein
MLSSITQLVLSAKLTRCGTTSIGVAGIDNQQDAVSNVEGLNRWEQPEILRRAEALSSIDRRT